ncbi:poly-beta-1,6-N-acetyl-D-glucosamine synthase [Chromohalobacter moromii]|uniref:Poly-beta-1,6-N-acetyl-D-glucosamine synthase n=3 Tax=Halomonadaceae TaxID=28256 RepID=A0A9X2X4G7_9GAMM|nr:poly-beta-1,6-N-acetyl-D-glucosamine synthase [Chromohalobacter moromii]MCK2047306.1 poly-beta-1,6 N-acetyl-D-glucosamine synthase [Chromohalobacter moromii]MCT8506884.1 poly-beta-1,6 N-acetyl-D-glucosamine synthase [Chromohalobacter moromii]
MIDALVSWILTIDWRATMFGFAFYYPIFMAWMWIIGGLWFYLRRERGHTETPRFEGSGAEVEPVSIVIPCHDEADQIEQTIRYALATHYPRVEVIAVNDGSQDATGAILDRLAESDARLRVIHFGANQGKAVALKAGTLAACSDYLVTIDGDALIHPHAVYWMMRHLTGGPRVGAVSGNPRILNRSTLLGKIQVGEFSSIIGLIKRAQRTYGRIFTVSGVITGFNRAALDSVGYWRADMVTEDIDISWRLQMDHWDIRFEPEALCYIYMPETLKGLWQQRLRWAQGGVEVMRRYGRGLFAWRQRRFWGVAIEYFTSLIWAYVMLAIAVLFCLGPFVPLPQQWRVATLLPQWNGLLLGATCLIQFLVSLYIDQRYERMGFLRHYFWVIWYPLLYWTLSTFTAVVAVPKTLLSSPCRRARWQSPDRGIQTDKDA